MDMARGVVAEIKSIHYDWWDGDRDTEPPAGAEHFAGTVQVLIGEVGIDRADAFDLLVCSPGRLAEYYQPDHWDAREALPGGNVLPVTGVWLMKAWDRLQFEEALQRLVRASGPGPDFATVAARIGRVVPWEYDYRHDDAVNRSAGIPELSASLWHDE